MGNTAADAIVSEREKNGPYKDIFDFIRRINFSNITSKNIENLVLSGAFDSFGQLRREDFFAVNTKGEKFIELFIRHGQNYQQEIANIKNSLFGGDDDIEVATPPIMRGEEWSPIELLNKERELVGIYLSAHPLDNYRIVLENLCNTHCNELENIPQLTNREQIIFGGIVTSVVSKLTKKGLPFGVVHIEDFNGGVDLTMWSEDWGRWRGMFQEDNILYITASLSKRYSWSEEAELKIQNVEFMQSVKENAIEKITIIVNADLLEMQMVEELGEMINECSEGNTRLFFQVRDTTGRRVIALKSISQSIDVSEKLLAYITNHNNISYKIN